MSESASKVVFNTATVGAEADNVRAASRASNAVIAYTILRVSFGANIMLHGVSRIVMGHAAFLAYLTHYFEKAPYFPGGMLSSFATVQPWVELILGLLLVIGLATRFSLIAGGLVILCLVIGTNLAQDWLVSGLQLIYAFLYYYLLVHLDQNRYSIDGLRKR
jgi:thiosulfate dehydrogenase [quinone] large subunit